MRLRHLKQLDSKDAVLDCCQLRYQHAIRATEEHSIRAVIKQKLLGMMMIQVHTEYRDSLGSGIMYYFVITLNEKINLKNK